MYYANNAASGTTYNTAIGYEVMKGSSTAANNTGQYNTATGYQAMDVMTTASYNSAYGYNAGGGLTTGDSNILIGISAGAALTTESQLIYIGDLIWGSMLRDSLRLAGDVALTGDLWYEDTFWDDLNTPATSAKISPVTSKPAFDEDSLALYWNAQDTAAEMCYYNFQMPHRWKAGTSIYPHVHYIQASGADTTEFFIIMYKWVDMGEQRPANATRVQTNNQTVYTYSSGSIHQLASFPAISGSGHTESSVLQIKLMNYYVGSDMYTLDFDIHFEIDKPGSDLQFP